MANEPAGFCCMCSINGLDDGIAAMTDLAGTGALAAELVALPVADLGPEQAARLVLALLGEAGALMSLVLGLGLPVHVAAGRTEPVKLNETSGGWIYPTALLGLDGGAGLVDPDPGGQGRG